MFACKMLATALLFNLHMMFQSVVAASVLVLKFITQSMTDLCIVVSNHSSW